jgi:ankyrin repeat protein
MYSPYSVYAAPEASHHQNSDEMIVDAITSGSLAAFMQCSVGRYDIDRRLLPYRHITPVPRVNPNEHYPTIRGPTIVMLCILCENEQILEYVLETKHPDLNVTVNGFNAIHLAAMIKHSGPLQVLLRYDWVQANINVAVEQVGMRPESGNFTTALHCAVSNRRVANVILLVSEFPPCRRHPPPQSRRGAPAADPGDLAPHYMPANVDRRAVNGALPLHLAVLGHAYDVCRVLLAAGADSTLAGDGFNRASPVELARQLADSARASEAPADDVTSEVQRVEELLSGPGRTETLDDLRAEFVPKVEPSPAPSAGPGVGPGVEARVGPRPDSGGSLSRILGRLNALDQGMQRVEGRLERRNGPM